jgi:hypothetical protein
VNGRLCDLQYQVSAILGDLLNHGLISQGEHLTMRCVRLEVLEGWRPEIV